MVTITLEYNARNSAANKIIDVILAMDNVFRVKAHNKLGNSNITYKAMQDAENGNTVVCESYEEYLKQTAKYA